MQPAVESLRLYRAITGPIPMFSKCSVVSMGGAPKPWDRLSAKRPPLSHSRSAFPPRLRPGSARRVPSVVPPGWQHAGGRFAFAVMNVKQAAQRLEISVSLTYHLIAEGRLPCVRIGKAGCRGKIIVRQEDIDDFLSGVRSGGQPPRYAFKHLR